MCVWLVQVLFELVAGTHAELAECFPEVVVDRADADEQLGDDFLVGGPVGRVREEAAFSSFASNTGQGCLDSFAPVITIRADGLPTKGGMMATTYRLAYGTHPTPDEGRCAMEWVSYLAGEPHGDEPACVSPALRSFCTTLNDRLEDEPRQKLRPYLARTIGTAEDGLDGARSWMAMDWLIRVYTPTWLAVAGMVESARQLAGLPEVADSADPDSADLQTALALLGSVRRSTRGVCAAALGAARIAAWTPWAAGRSAAREAAWGSAGAAAWAAARVAVGDIAGDRARALAREIGGDAAAVVAREARNSVDRASARVAAREALAPTLEELRHSAFDLLDRMLPTVPLQPPVIDDAGQFGFRAALSP